MPIGITMGAVGALQAGTAIYQTKKAGSVNERSIDAQRSESDQALRIEAEENARRQERYDAAVAFDQARWDDYVRVNTPFWQVGPGVG